MKSCQTCKHERCSDEVYFNCAAKDYQKWEGREEMSNGMPELKPGTVVEMKNGEKFLLIKSADDGIIGWNLNNAGNFGSGFDFNFVDKIFVVKKAAFLTDDNLETIWERKPATDWSKVEVDTKVLIKVNNGCMKRYFAKYENEIVYVFEDGCTSFTAGKTDGWFHSTVGNEVVLYEGNEHLVGDKHE